MQLNRKALRKLILKEMSQLGTGPVDRIKQIVLLPGDDHGSESSDNYDYLISGKIYSTTVREVDPYEVSDIHQDEIGQYFEFVITREAARGFQDEYMPFEFLNVHGADMLIPDFPSNPQEFSQSDQAKLSGAARDYDALIAGEDLTDYDAMDYDY